MRYSQQGDEYPEMVRQLRWVKTKTVSTYWSKVNFREEKDLKQVLVDYSPMIKITRRSTILLIKKKIEAMNPGSNCLRGTWLIIRRGRHMGLVRNKTWSPWGTLRYIILWKKLDINFHEERALKLPLPLLNVYKIQ